MKPAFLRLKQAIDGFNQARSPAAFKTLIKRLERCLQKGPDSGFTNEINQKLSQAILFAAETDDYKLQRAALDNLSYVAGHIKTKVAIILKGLLAKQESVRIAAWGAIDGKAVSLSLLKALEAKPPRELLFFEVLMAIDHMYSLYLTGPKDKARMARFVKKLEMTPGPALSSLTRWKIADTLYDNLHLGLNEAKPD